MRAQELFVQAARELTISATQIPGTNVYQLEHGNKTIYLNESRTSEMTVLASRSCNNKNLTKHLLKNAGISTPRWVEFYKGSTEEDIIKYSGTLQFPVVVKPYTGSHGDNITIDIATPEAVVPYVQDLQKNNVVVIVEEMFSGTEVRLLTTKTQLLAATVRRPASVLGDGEHTIAELVAAKNAEPNRIPRDNSAALQYLELGEVELGNLHAAGFTPASIPPVNQRVYLQKVSNLAYGGDSIDVTDQLHPSVREIAIHTINSIPGLPFAGIDFMTKDYTAEQTPDSYSIVEVNSNPMIDMHYQPYKGSSRNVAFDIWQELFMLAS